MTPSERRLLVRTLCIVFLTVFVCGCTALDAGRATGKFEQWWDWDPKTGEWIPQSKKEIDIQGAEGSFIGRGSPTFDFGSPNLELDGMKGKGGGSKMKVEGIVGRLSTVPGIMSITGIACIVGGGVWLAISKLSAWKSAGIIIGIGGLLLVGAFIFETYSSMVLALFLAVVAGVGYMIYLQYKKWRLAEEKRQVDATQEVIVRAIEDSPEDVQTSVKAKVVVLAGKFADEVKAVITAAKERAGI